MIVQKVRLLLPYHTVAILIVIQQEEISREKSSRIDALGLKKFAIHLYIIRLNHHPFNANIKNEAS